MRMQEDEQVRAYWRIRWRGAVPHGTMPMPAMPVAQMPRTDSPGLARMAPLALVEPVGADSNLVLNRQNAHRRDVLRRGRKPRRTPIRSETARNRGCFRGFWGKNGGPGEAEKAPRGGFSPANQGLRAAGRSRLIDHCWFQ